MCHLIETLRIENGLPLNLGYHERRYSRSVLSLFGVEPATPLGPVICCPEFLKESVVKCRIVYERSLLDISYEIYMPRRIRNLKIVNGDGIDYSFKYADREIFDRLKAGVEEDDVLITKNGLLTELSFANVALLKNGKWYTPADPLLEGTRRASLLDAGLLIPADIRASELSGFTELRYFNAMVGWGEAEPVTIRNIG